MSPWLHSFKANHTFFSGLQPKQKAISRMSCDSQGSTGPTKCPNTRLKSLHPSKEWNKQHSKDDVLWLFSVASDIISHLWCCFRRNSGSCRKMYPLYHDWRTILGDLAGCVSEMTEQNRFSQDTGCLPVESVHNNLILSPDILSRHRHNEETWKMDTWKMRCCCTSGGLTPSLHVAIFAILQVAKGALGWIE